MNRVWRRLAAALTIVGAPCSAQVPDKVWDAREMAAFIDGVMQAQSEAFHFAGAVVTVVHDGDVLFSKGYGYADFAERKPVDPARTLFRIASNSKMFVWTAVMQLVEQGNLDLHTDVNQYLKTVEIPATFPEPITLEHLMTHTAGFEDRVVRGLFGRDASSMRPLAEVVKRDMPARVFPPGKVTAYSNYGTALAALIVEQVSGIPFESYLQQRILEPLGMRHAAIAQPLPAHLAADVSKGYRWAGDRFLEQPFEFTVWAPAGGMSVSAEDMGRFMIAHLNDGAIGDHRILAVQTAREMRENLISISPRINGMLHGFMELGWRGEPAYGHTGDTLFHSETLMLPARKLGVFVAYNTANAYVARDQFHSAFLEHYFPAPLPKEPVPVQAGIENLARFAGSYSMSRAPQTTMASVIRLLAVTSVSIDPAGYLVTTQAGRAQRWRQVEPLVFAEVDGYERLVFRENERGEVVDLGMSPVGTTVWQKQPWWNSQPFQVPVVVASLVILVGALVGYPIAAVLQRKRSAPSGAKLARLAAWLTSFAFVVGFLSFLTGVGPDPTQTVALYIPPSVRVGLVLWIAGAVLTPVVAAGAAWSWRSRWWAVPGRTCLTLVSLAAISLTLWLNHWNLLGFKY